MINKIDQFQNVFFIGVAGVGMSAIAQYLKGIGKDVSGSDRYFHPDEYNKTKTQLEAEGIKCFLQDGSGIDENTDLVVVSTAIEDTVYEVQKAKELGISIIRRSELLSIIAKSKKTIAVAGTSGKSTTSAMLYQILLDAGFQPSIISGAGLTSIIKQGKIGNAAIGKGDWLIIEADESDGSVVQYEPEIGLLLNIDKDHQEIEELIDLFTIFKNNTKGLFIVNQSNTLAKTLSADLECDFGFEDENARYSVTDFSQNGFYLSFRVLGQAVNMNSIGRHSAENAAAAIAVANQIGIDLEICADSLEHYEGIYRRHQILGQKNGVWVIDDYAHNPAKCAASIKACQPLAKKLIAWFQPHGYKPTKFLRNDFVEEISHALRPQDEIWMSEIFYAGGTAEKDISANDLVKDISANGKKAFFVENRNDLLEKLRPELTEGTVLLLMGARDPSLEEFCKKLYEQL
ncbi:UDP-N-acetylmuramate--L-alanine ligase [Chryseobacterium koreense]|uniref:UDP-N-acetylmuramate--alanine ligase n=1 Tax=Chryseobacterium koreense CCUG 49689 TaxID=1304281 RepID=A0A0J7IYT7_9FLAO|nr:Mur ligase family protein [Chryseobacterium koreense]KMQ71413.1 UDP-N-acetylmuramate--alanine ligase [Chryseobacterium koreense CCUG 49689]MBB5332253.1 UDP-N-acetylmuramate--alanine ligase [Chryseobacterium koreense]